MRQGGACYFSTFICPSPPSVQIPLYVAVHVRMPRYVCLANQKSVLFCNDALAADTFDGESALDSDKWTTRDGKLDQRP